MEINTEQKGGVLVALTVDRVDGSNAREFQEALQAVIKDTGNAFLLDMEQLTYISSAGLRVILLIARTLQGKNTKFAVCSLSDSVREVFEISGFDKIVATHATQSDAIAALEG